MRITVTEARQRLAVNAMTLRVVLSAHEPYRVSYNEFEAQGRGEHLAYFTDDLEDAVIAAGKMRRKFTRNLQPA